MDHIWLEPSNRSHEGVGGLKHVIIRYNCIFILFFEGNFLQKIKKKTKTMKTYFSLRQKSRQNLTI